MLTPSSTLTLSSLGSPNRQIEEAVLANPCWPCPAHHPTSSSFGHKAGSQPSHFLSIILFIYFLAVLGLCCYVGFSLAAVRRGYSLAAVCGLLIAVASLVQSTSSRGRWLR